MKMNSLLHCVLGGVFLGGMQLPLHGVQEREQETVRTPVAALNPGSPWPATDALRRELPVTDQPNAIRANRCVGIFYFLTHGEDRGSPAKNIMNILAQDPDILTKPDSKLWGGGGSYYWAEPLYGYYNSKDPWVIRRHANLLVDAGIDTVIFDTTNRITYRDVYMQICEVWSQIRREGGRTPQICFMVNTKAGESAAELFNDLYRPGIFQDLWFVWNGKPLLICDPKETTAELAEFFTLRKAHWPFTLVNTHNAWHWEATYPQVYSYDDDPSIAEQVNVSVAQNLRRSDGKVTNMSDGDARGRSFHDKSMASEPNAVNKGYNFAEQWERAIEIDPPFVMVTGWNEWTAGKYSRPQRPVVFVDQYDHEYSRDIEPVKGLHNDNYYCQLVANVRRYKGQLSLPSPTAMKSIDIASSFDQWHDVGPDFVDHSFDIDHRNFGKEARHYHDSSGRNDFTLLKVARDAKAIYFYAQSTSPWTPSSDPQWACLLIDADQNASTGWEGYDYVLNRSIEANETWLERNMGGWNWERVAKVPFRVENNQLMLAIERDRIGLHGNEEIQFDFKWIDNSQQLGNILDTYLSGDAAPDGRFRYRYEFRKQR
jgi:hypothetical protein